MIACRSCENEVYQFDVNLVVCFSCMTVSHPDRHNSQVKIKRKPLGQWIIGSNRQLTTNELWAKQLEELYAIWIAKLIEKEAGI